MEKETEHQPLLSRSEENDERESVNESRTEVATSVQGESSHTLLIFPKPKIRRRNEGNEYSSSDDDEDDACTDTSFPLDSHTSNSSGCIDEPSSWEDSNNSEDLRAWWRPSQKKYISLRATGSKFQERLEKYKEVIAVEAKKSEKRLLNTKFRITTGVGEISVADLIPLILTYLPAKAEVLCRVGLVCLAFYERVNVLPQWITCHPKYRGKTFTREKRRAWAQGLSKEELMGLRRPDPLITRTRGQFIYSMKLHAARPEIQVLEAEEREKYQRRQRLKTSAWISGFIAVAFAFTFWAGNAVMTSTSLSFTTSQALFGLLGGITLFLVSISCICFVWKVGQEWDDSEGDRDACRKRSPVFLLCFFILSIVGGIIFSMETLRVRVIEDVAGVPHLQVPRLKSSRGTVDGYPYVCHNELRGSERVSSTGSGSSSTNAHWEDSSSGSRSKNDDDEQQQLKQYPYQVDINTLSSEEIGWVYDPNQIQNRTIQKNSDGEAIDISILIAVYLAIPRTKGNAIQQRQALEVAHQVFKMDSLAEIPQVLATANLTQLSGCLPVVAFPRKAVVDNRTIFNQPLQTFPSSSPYAGWMTLSTTTTVRTFFSVPYDFLDTPNPYPWTFDAMEQSPDHGIKYSGHNLPALRSATRALWEEHGMMLISPSAMTKYQNPKVGLEFWKLQRLLVCVGCGFILILSCALVFLGPLTVFEITKSASQWGFILIFNPLQMTLWGVICGDSTIHYSKVNPEELIQQEDGGWTTRQKDVCLMSKDAAVSLSIIGIVLIVLPLFIIFFYVVLKRCCK